MSGEFPPDLQTLGKRADRRQRLDAKFVIPLAADEVVDDGDVVALSRQIQRGCPTAVAVAAEHR